MSAENTPGGKALGSQAWGGRFASELHEAAARLSSSVAIDQRLAACDIRGSLAHVRMLATTGILDPAEAARIGSGLQEIGADIAAGRFIWRDADEDVHLNIEAELIRRIGDVGGKLHTARSRNDQVATDLRLWTRDATTACMQQIGILQGVLVLRAAAHIDQLMPGYTHLQRAQPVRLAHHLLAWCEMLQRDHSRLQDALHRLDECPLGAGALATTPFAIDRQQTAAELGFRSPMRNSLDAVADRDFVVECVAALSLCAVHLSRIAEELILWSSQEFGFVRMSDAFATGSSMMPQKKNPDLAELVRGKCGRVVGHLVSLLVMLKGLPLAYNRDMQEDKTPLFDAFDTVQACLSVMAPMLASLEFQSERLQAALQDGYLNATELADYLSAKGLPFRRAHHVVGQLVALAEAEKVPLEQLSLEQLRKHSPLFEADVYACLEAQHAVERRDVFGGPARRRVEQALQDWRARLSGRGIDLMQIADQFSLPSDHA